ncbi:Hypothetical Protein FCC1311_098252 [Hondaea fermentalgiana]|uniref:EF-hand domain-containing protein n=1 Tax=Hondaea fermentalgiana TaxID=2315210 RepID=A0A2R5GRU8_9STRA|nr:Hypothetical Protein FCC1311_098252 [Hondaea fermentalgiana]|eukprot:GBG33602.1 Hypothetical Protein FCC1311_098252 [Hondaea fermentalgiana]
MGAASSVSHGEQRKRHSLVSKPGRVRKSILLTSDPKDLSDNAFNSRGGGDEALPTLAEDAEEGRGNQGQGQGQTSSEGINVSSVVQVKANIFQVQVPHGVPPGGMFSAVCNNRYVKVEIPMDCQPGDFIEIDLTDVEDDEPSTLDGLSTDYPEQKLKRAAALFMQYDTDKNYCITMAQLEKMLENEFNFPPGAESTLREMSYADVDKSHSLTFDEFCHWLEHLQIRLELHRLQEKQRHLDIKKEDADREEEERKLKDLLSEQQKLREQTENQMQSFLLEIEVLKKEKERLENFKANYTEGSDEYAELTGFEARNNEKLRKMELHHRENAAMIEKMKQDYRILHQQREEEEHAQKEAQRKKLQAKMEERKRLKAQHEQPDPSASTAAAPDSTESPPTLQEPEAGPKSSEEQIASAGDESEKTTARPPIEPMADDGASTARGSPRAVEIVKAEDGPSSARGSPRAAERAYENEQTY